MIVDRGADYSALNGLTMAADNAWCAGIVLGPEIPGWRDLDVDELTGALYWNDEPMAPARIGDADPFGSLAWVASVLTGAGRALKAGEVVITGSVIRTRAPKPGDHVRYRIGAGDGDGAEVEVSFA
jgi:2-keto-4-pentenoate hydratase